MKRSGMVLLLVMVLAGSFFSGARAANPVLSCGDTVYLDGTAADSLVCMAQHYSAAKDDTKKKKFVSALLAFPFPFGFMGAHRVMLGTKPWVPVVYVATFGGCFGLLPLIDFCVLAFSKDISQYENNPHIFMWVTTPESPPKQDSGSE